MKKAVISNQSASATGERLISQFISQVYRQPQASALLCEGQNYSYHQLACRAATIVNSLADFKTHCNALVLMLPRGLDFIAAMLASQYLAIPYIPLDHNCSSERLGQILDSGEYGLLYNDQTEAKIGVNQQRQYTINITKLPSSSVTLANVEHLQASYDRHTEAYRIYTSGSTGEPKAVMVAELGCRNLLGHFCREVAASRPVSWLSSTSVAFDIFYLEYAVPLALGGQLILMSDRQLQSPQAVARQITSHNPDVYQATPSMYKCLLPYLPSQWRFKRALVGGEKLGAQLSQQLFERADWLCNVYGPTETTVWSSSHVITEPGDNRIGQPIDNTTIYILDEHLQPLEQGLAGRIFIAGKGLAFGYFKNEALSEQKFVWSSQTGVPERIYDTGDIGYIDADNLLVYLHRDGDFHKVNGYRVDTGEIVDALEKIEDVAEAAVLVVEDPHTESSRIIAYVRSVDGSSISLDDIRRQLESRLAKYLLPHQLFQLSEFDYTTSGKLDSKALLKRFKQQQAIDLKNNTASHEQAMATSDEQQPQQPQPQQQPIMAVLSNYINISGLGGDDNLFHRGLTSMQAISLHLDLTELLPALELHQLFDEPTLNGITQGSKTGEEQL